MHAVVIKIMITPGIMVLDCTHGNRPRLRYRADWEDFLYGEPRTDLGA